YVVCEGLRRMLEQEEDICVVGEAQTGQEALTRLQTTTADVVLLDVRLADLDGIEILRRLKLSHPHMKVVMLTSYGDEYLSPSIEAGANGYLLKRANRAEMVKSIREVVRGGVPLDSLVTPGLLQRVRTTSGHPTMSLSDRETEVLELAAKGLGNKAIAYRLGLTQTTIKNHMTSIMRKLNANDRTHAVTIALRKGWISNPVQGNSEYS
ncbi:MAG: response regulator, partial [Dehalococcoidia bacterium]